MSGRGKRPDLPGGRPRSLRVRLAHDEHAELVARAGAQGVSVARYLLTLALTGEPPAARRELRGELLETRRQLVRLGANVNQATVHAHTTGDVGALVRMAGQVEAGLQRLDAVLGSLR